MPRVVWPDSVLDQLEQIGTYIEVFDPAAGARLQTRLRRLGESLATFPNRGRPSADGTRELVTVPPYILRYEVNDDTLVTILHIRHGARRPID